MKKQILTSAVLAAAVLLASGCSSTGGEKGDGDGTGGAGTGAGAGDGSAQTTGIGPGGAWTGNPVEDPNSPLYNKVLYFDFDVSEIRSEYLDMLRAHASYLAGNPNVTVTIEGHCDERGSREYNIGLGERRANAVQQFMQAEGVDPAQITTISYGEERPDDPGHSEAAWAMNRRAMLVY
ncbi:MAG: peptidoglycan-associated lipoprotein Pal [bacterium]